MHLTNTQAVFTWLFTIVFCQHRYWGERLPHHTDYHGLGERKANYAVEGHILPSNEYPAWGGFLYTEPCLKVTFADSVRDLVLVYSQHHQEIGQEGLPVLVITLKDNYYPLEIDLYYKVVPRYNLIQHWTVICNTSQEWLEVEAALSAAWQRFKPKRAPQAI